MSRKTGRLAAILLLAVPLKPADLPYVIQTVAGSDFVGDGGPAVSALLSNAEGVAVDAAGNLYIADAGDHRVRKVSASGIISTVAGNGHPGFKGDGGPAAAALLNRPYGLAVDAGGNLYIADHGNGRVRKVTPDGIIRTVAGGGQAETAAEGTEAAAARLLGPRNVAVDGAGNLYVSDFLDHRVYRVTPLGRILVVAGTGVNGTSGTGGSGASAQLSFPAGLAVDRAGALYIVESSSKCVRRLVDGIIRSVALPFKLDLPTGIGLDPSGTVYIADDARIVKVAPSGTVNTIALPARDLAVDATGNLYVAAAGPQVKKLTGASLLAVAGSGGDFWFLGDGGPADRARLGGPTGIALDAEGNLYIADGRNGRVRKVTAAGQISTFAGLGRFGPLGDGGPAALAALYWPAGLAYGNAGSLWIADPQASRIRRVAPNGIISTAAGNGLPGFNGDGSPATAMQLNFPNDAAVDSSGNLYVADTNNHVVRKVTPSGTISTVAGRGLRGYGGDGGPATSALLDSPAGVAIDKEGNLYIADRMNHAIRKVTAAGRIATAAGTGMRGFGGDGGPATQARLNFPSGVAVDGEGNLYVADTGNNRIRKVTPDGVIRTIAGDGTPGFGGDGGPALSAQLNFPSDLALDAAGNLYVADQDNHRVRKLAPAAELVPPPLEEAAAVVNAASLLAGPVAPGEIVTIFGPGIGPATAVAGRLNATGLLENKLADTEVLFDGRAAALLYAGPNQINAQAPYALAAQKETRVEVLHQGVSKLKMSLMVAEAAPGIFTVADGTGQALAINEDGTLNSADNPAPRGSIVTVYATGEGQTNPPAVEGKPAAAPLPQPLAPLALSIGLLRAEILFAGSAPAVVGVLQVNARIPAGFAPSGILPVELTVGTARSQPRVTIAVR